MNGIANSWLIIICSTLAGGWLGVGAGALYRHLRRRRASAAARQAAAMAMQGQGVITFLDGSTAHLKPGDAVRWSSDDAHGQRFASSACAARHIVVTEGTEESHARSKRQ